MERPMKCNYKYAQNVFSNPYSIYRRQSEWNLMNVSYMTIVENGIQL